MGLPWIGHKLDLVVRYYCGTCIRVFSEITYNQPATTTGGHYLLHPDQNYTNLPLPTVVQYCVIFKVLSVAVFTLLHRTNGNINTTITMAKAVTSVMMVC